MPRASISRCLPTKRARFTDAKPTVSILPTDGKSFLSFPRSGEGERTRERERERVGLEIDRKPRGVVANGPLPLTTSLERNRGGSILPRWNSFRGADGRRPFRGRRSRKEEEESRPGIIALESGIPRSARGPPGIRGVPRPSGTATCVHRSACYMPNLDYRHFPLRTPADRPPPIFHGPRDAIKRLGSGAIPRISSCKFSPYILFRHPSLSNLPSPPPCFYDALRVSRASRSHGNGGREGVAESNRP